jgi:CRISPR-associated protein Csd1
MMLQALIEYAEREGLGDADFSSADVRWEIPLDAKGRLCGGPIALSEDATAKKPLPKKMLRPFTSVNELGQGDKSHFLCDTLERCVLMENEKTVPARRVQHGYFKTLLEETANAVPEVQPQLAAVLAFLNDEEAIAALHAQLTKAKAKVSENAIFTVDGMNLLQHSGIKQFWRERRKAANASTVRSQRVCIATGELAQTLDTTEKITGVPGGLAMGTNLISFDKDAFCSYGLEQAQNAALSAPAELKIRSALNSLIQRSKSQRLVFNDTIHLHWTREEMPVSDPLDDFLTADPEAIASLLQSVKNGSKYIGLEANRYYCMSLSGNGARIVVRDWLELTVPEVAQNIADWFEDLGIIDPNGVDTKHDFKFGALLYGMVRAEIDELPPALAAQLLHCALQGRSHPLPQTALAAALRRQQLDQEDKLKPARLAIIKACLIRSPELNPNPMTEALNPESKDAAYLCGRLFAVFDRLQYLALGSVNAGVVERFYASASTTPSLVMGRLFRNAQFHLAKANEGAAENVRKDFEGLSAALGNDFPSSLSLEQQGRFALGYYHQKADYRRRSAENKEARENAEAAKIQD